MSAAAIQEPKLISAVAREIGSQSVVVVVDVRRQDDDYAVWTHNGRRQTGQTVVEAARMAESFGAGEIVVNSIDNDGRMKEYDLTLAAKVRNAVRLPMTMLGGAGSLADIGKLIDRCGVVGAAAGSLFVFKGSYRAVLISYPTPTQKEQLFLSSIGRRTG